MPKEEMPQPDYEKVKSIDEVDKRVVECQRTISKKYKLRVQAEEGKRDTTASYNEQIKHLKQELDHELGVLSGWETRRKVLSKQGAAEDQEFQEPEPNVQTEVRVKGHKAVVIPGAPASAAVPAPPAPPPAPGPVASAPLPPTAHAAHVPMPPPPAAAPIPPPPAAAAPQASGQGKMVPFPTKRAAS